MVKDFVEKEVGDVVTIEHKDGRWFAIKGDIQVTTDKGNMIITGDIRGDMDLAKEYFKRHAEEWFAKWVDN